MARKREEDAAQKWVVEFIERACPGVLVFHVPNGGKRSKTEAAILKGLGVRAGVPDLILLWPGHVAGLEMKAPKGKPTPEQEAIGEKFIQMGHQWGVARSPEEAIALMARWGVPTKARGS